jgi:hypothetical protein
MTNKKRVRVRTRAAISVNGRSKKAHLTHLLEDLGVECLVSTKIRSQKYISQKPKRQISEVVKTEVTKSEVTKPEVRKTEC